MKVHTSEFKEEIKKLGRQLSSKITYGETELGNEELNSVTPHYESTILKSVMKQLDVDSNVEIPLKTIINYQFGVKVGNEYEYLDYGNYVVYKVEKQEDKRSWKITCYDKMLYAMKPYESLGVSFPISIKDYLQAICTKLGLTLTSGNFANEDKMIMNELYLDASGNGLDYTFRDVLDEIAQATGSTICINENDELEVRYPQNVGEYETVEGTDLLLENVDDGKDIDYELNGDTTQDGTPTPTTPIEIETVTGRQEIKVEGKNRFDYTKNSLYENAVNTETIDGGIKVSIRTAGGYRYAVYDLGETSQLTGKTIRVKARFEASSTNIPSYTLIYCNDSGGNRSSIVTATTSDEIISTIVANNNTHIALSLYANNNSTSQPVDTYVNFYDILVTIDEEDMAYEEYKGQSYEINLGNIELCKIRNYKDFIRKGTRKNLFGFNISAIDKTETYRTNATQRLAIEGTENPNECKFTFNSGTYCRGYFEIDGIDGTLPYTLSFNIKENTSSYTPFYTIDTTNSTHDKFVFYINGNNGSATGNTGKYFILTNIQLELGNQSTLFEPYGTNGKWLLHKEIGKVAFDGSESNWANDSSGKLSGILIENIKRVTTTSGVIEGYCNRYQNGSLNSSRNNTNHYCCYSGTTTRLYFNNQSMSLTDFKTWLSTNNVIVYYVLETPTTTEITDTELINQLKAVELLEGMNNIFITSGDLSTPLKLTYLSEMDTIDEEYLKDVNVNFGEKFGPVNSVVLSRAAESDSIYEKDDESVEQNGLTEVKIKDNQILNGNNRDEFLPSIFEKLNGLEYYLTDFSSTGVTYYDLLDKYKINVFDNSYKTIMLNNEVDITQGLEEQIYADRLEESETDYTKSDKTDRKINQAYIIVDKQNQQINSVVQNINTLQSVVNNQGEQVDALGTRLTQTVDNITASVTSIQTEVDNGVSLVKTNSVIIDDSGLNVSTDNSKISTTMTNNSFEIKDSGDNMLAFFGYDETENISKSQMDNLTVTNYFVSGYHRTEKFERNGERRTGHFYIG